MFMRVEVQLKMGGRNMSPSSPALHGGIFIKYHYQIPPSNKQSEERTGDRAI